MHRGLSRSADVLRISPAAPTHRTADALVEILAEAGVEIIFGLPGGAIAPIEDAILDRSDVRMMTMRHEADAVFAAAAYARATGKLGVVTVTSGPGVLNTVTGIASAHCDGLPVLVLAGEVPKNRFGKGAFQEGSVYELDIVGVARSLTKMSEQMNDANSACALLRRAIATAMSGRKGPVLLTVPLDVTTAKIRTPLLEVSPRVEFELNAKTALVTADALMNAKRGVLFVGSGAIWGGGPKLVRELAERLQMPVMTTPKAKGVFPESHPLSLGVFGWGGHPSTSAYLEGGVDVLMAIGTGLGEVASDNWSPLLKASEHFIHLDAIAQQIGRNYPVTIGLVGTVESVLPKLLPHVHRQRTLRRFGVERRDSGEVVLVGKENRIAPQRAIWELQRVMPRNTLWTSDIGEHMLFAIHHLVVEEPSAFTLQSGLASMGSALGAAIGLKSWRPNAPVAAIVGDGGFSMSIGALATAAKEKIPMVVAVMNDDRYGMVEIGHSVIFGRSPEFSGGGHVDISELARGAGAYGVTIEEPGQILELDFSEITAPVVLDIRIDRSVQMSRARLEFLKELTTPKKKLN